MCKFVMRFADINEEEAEVETEAKVDVINLRVERSTSKVSHYESDDETRADRKEKMRRMQTKRDYRRFETGGTTRGVKKSLTMRKHISMQSQADQSKQQISPSQFKE